MRTVEGISTVRFLLSHDDGTLFIINTAWHGCCFIVWKRQGTGGPRMLQFDQTVQTDTDATFPQTMPVTRKQADRIIMLQQELDDIFAARHNGTMTLVQQERTEAIFKEIDAVYQAG
jgi:hypothetical protein